MTDTKLVPCEPTAEMVTAARKDTMEMRGEWITAIWRAMYDAAPAAAPPEREIGTIRCDRCGERARITIASATLPANPTLTASGLAQTPTERQERIGRIASAEASPAAPPDERERAEATNWTIVCGDPPAAPPGEVAELIEEAHTLALTRSTNGPLSDAILFKRFAAALASLAQERDHANDVLASYRARLRDALREIREATYRDDSLGTIFNIADAALAAEREGK